MLKMIIKKPKGTSKLKKGQLARGSVGRMNSWSTGDFKDSETNLYIL